MTIEKLIAEIHRKKSFLCIGLDADMDKIPLFLLGETSSMCCLQTKYSFL
jgi:orotidine-5'-phosphate decarboxylase